MCVSRLVSLLLLSPSKPFVCSILLHVRQKGAQQRAREHNLKSVEARHMFLDALSVGDTGSHLLLYDVREIKLDYHEF